MFLLTTLSKAAWLRVERGEGGGGGLTRGGGGSQIQETVAWNLIHDNVLYTKRFVPAGPGFRGWAPFGHARTVAVALHARLHKGACSCASPPARALHDPPSAGCRTSTCVVVVPCMNACTGTRAPLLRENPRPLARALRDSETPALNGGH